MDSSVEGSHYKQSSGELANEKLVKGEKGPTCVCSLQTTESYIVAQAVSLVKETSPTPLHEVFVHQDLVIICTFKPGECKP